MKKINIGFYDAKPYDINSFDSVADSYKNFEIKYFKSHLTVDSAVMSKGCKVVCAFVNDSISREVIDELVKNGVEIIALRCAGYNNVDFEAAHEKVKVVRVPAYSPFAVAEHTIALIMSLNRKTHRAYLRTKDNNFNIDGLLGFDLHGKTAGVIGTGKIGKILIGILNGFGMKVVAYDKFPDKDFEKTGALEYVSLEKLYAQSNIISLNCPLNSETYHMINSDSIDLMKQGVMIINTGRGKLVNTKSLIEGLKSKKIGSAGLDVYEEESEYFFEDFSNSLIEDDQLARLLSFNNVLVTSHQAFFTKEALNNIAVTTMNNIKDYFEGKELINEICYNCPGNKPEK